MHSGVCVGMWDLSMSDSVISVLLKGLTCNVGLGSKSHSFCRLQ